jgi:AcrR family transcriptional regulator
MASRAGKQLLTRQDWIDAALRALAADGDVRAVAVDRLAKSLGATRGSFYWHFTDRDDLVTAALEQWERENTTALIPPLETIADPVERLRALFREVYEQRVDAIEIALASAGDQPLVEPVFARVTKARLDVLRRIFTDLGLPEADVDDRAWLGYALYIGHHQLTRAKEIRALRPEHLDRLVGLLTSPAGRTAQPAAAAGAGGPGEGST